MNDTHSFVTFGNQLQTLKDDQLKEVKQIQLRKYIFRGLSIMTGNPVNKMRT